MAQMAMVPECRRRLHHRLPLRLLPLLHCLFTGRPSLLLPQSKRKPSPPLHLPQTLWLMRMTHRACLLVRKLSEANLILVLPRSLLPLLRVPMPLCRLLHRMRVRWRTVATRTLNREQATHLWTWIRQSGHNLILSANLPRKTRSRPRLMPSKVYLPTHLLTRRTESLSEVWTRRPMAISTSLNTCEKDGGHRFPSSSHLRMGLLLNSPRHTHMSNNLRRPICKGVLEVWVASRLDSTLDIEGGASIPIC